MDAIYSELTGFNRASPTLMHIDLNSCFATVEQQANPLLRGKPIAVAAYTTGNGCILAPSIEAKRYGVKTGMRVRDGLSLCPGMIILPSDPAKYRFVNRKFLALFSEYTGDIEVKSIDEMVLDLKDSPAINRSILSLRDPDVYRGEAISTNILKDCRASLAMTESSEKAMLIIGQEIKRRIKAEIGEWLTVSVGISTNRFLAKTAAGLHKPDGLDVITYENIAEVLGKLKLEDICGIKEGNGGRLRMAGITTAAAFYGASINRLKLAFQSIVGYHWWLRLHGWEADDRQFDRKSFGHSYALYKPYLTTDTKLQQILCQLVEKMGKRLRAHEYTSQGIHVYTMFADYTSWHHGQKLVRPLYVSRDLFEAGRKVLLTAPVKPVRLLAVSCFNLSPRAFEQMKLFTDESRKYALTKALDKLTDRWGDFMVVPARMMNMEQKVIDRIAFGGVADLEDFVFQEQLGHEAL